MTFKKGQVFTEQHKQRLSESHKGIHPSDETRTKLSTVRKGHSVSENTRLRISEAKKSSEQSRKASIKAVEVARKVLHSQPVSEETRKKHSVETKARYDRIGRQIPDKRLTGYAVYKAFRNAVLTRDNLTCQRCGKQGCKLEVHHIKRWKLHPELRFDINNGITLCQDCHSQTADYGRGTHGV